MLLHREAYYHKDDEEWLNDPDNEEKRDLAELIIAKQRNGPTGVVKLTWDGSTVRFKNHDWRHSAYSGGGGGGVPFDEPAPVPVPVPVQGPRHAPPAQAVEPAPFDAPAPFNAFPAQDLGEPSPFDEQADAIASMPGNDPARPPGGAFAPGRRTGPAADHRDGGGPDTSLGDDLNEDDLDIPV
jgi:hypothetical protein